MAGKTHFSDFLEPGLRDIYFDEYRRLPEMYSQIFEVGNSTKQDETDTGVSGFGYFRQSSDGNPLQYEDPVQLYDVTYAHLTWKLGFKVTKEMYDDDQYNTINRLPKLLARAAQRTIENQGAAVLRRAFNTSYPGGDGLPLCSTAHLRADGGSSQSNASATGITLNDDNLETALIAFSEQLDHKGMLTGAMATDVILPPDLRKEGRILVESTGRPESADNDINVYNGELNIISWAWIGGAASGGSRTAWYLRDSTYHRLKLYMREAPNFENDSTFDTDEALFKGRMRFSVGFSDWYGFWGSQGDGAAYSD
jgi:phage major head subunit gpT-like protein